VPTVTTRHIVLEPKINAAFPSAQKPIPIVRHAIVLIEEATTLCRKKLAPKQTARKIKKQHGRTQIKERRSPRLKSLYLRPPKNGVDFGSRCQTFDLPGQAAFHSHIIGIKESDELAGGLPERFIPCRPRSAIFNQSIATLNQSFALKFFDYLPRSVRRSVVNC
jgi:hypothetical protein